jgi:hypothetical protein
VVVRTIHADLVTEQKKTAYTPSLSLAIQDNALPHPAVGLAHPMTGYSGAPSASVVAGAAIVRAHVAGGAVLVQRVTAPGTSSQWTTGWTSLTAGANYPALFYTGTYVVCVYQITATKAVCWKRSSDGGATWSAEQTIWTPAYNLGALVLGASGGATRSGVFYAYGTTVYFRLYDPTGDSFAAPASHDYGDAVGSFGVCWDAGNVFRLALALGAVAGDAYDARMPNVLATSTYTYGVSWSTPVIHVGLPTTIEVAGTPDYRSLANFTPAYVCLAKVGAVYWLTFRVVAGTGCALGNDIRMAVSDDGTYFSGSVKLGQANIADRLTPLVWSTGTTYLASDSVLLISTPLSTLSTTQAAIIRYQIDEGGPEARLEVVLDNRAGTFDGIETNRLGNDMVLARGAVCAGTARTVTREPFVIEDVQWSKDNKRVRLTGHNYAALMRFWRADLNYYWRGQTLQTLVQTIAALGGVQAVTFDASTFWTTVLPTFTLAPGTSALEALQSLQQQFQFVYRVSSSGAMYCFVLSDAPAADYVFGTATNEHPTLRARDTSKRRLPEITHVVVLGEDEHGGEKVLPVQSEAGFQRTRVVSRQYLTSTAECVAQALAMATKAEAVESQAIVYCLPSFGLELWDAAQSDGWAADQVRYVTNLIETWNTERADTSREVSLAMPFYQVITLADVDVTLRATGHGLPAPTALTHTYAEDGHHLAWFYPGKLTDVLFFEVVRNTDDAIDGNESLVYRGQNLQAVAAYSATAGDYFGVRAVGAGELASSWVWGGPYHARQITMQDDFGLYARPDISNLASLSSLQLKSMDSLSEWTTTSKASVDTTYVKEGAGSIKLLADTATWFSPPYLNDATAHDYSGEQRFTLDDYFCAVFYVEDQGHTGTYLSFLFQTDSSNYFGIQLDLNASYPVGWHHVAFKRSDFVVTGSPTWSNITNFQVVLSLGGGDEGPAIVYVDDLRISKADPDIATTYNDTGWVWDFLPVQGSGTSEWHVLPGRKTGEPNQDYMLAQLYSAAVPANWLLGWHTLADVVAGQAIVGTYLKAEGQTALAFCIQDATVANRTLYAVEVDTAANVVRLARWVAGARTQIASAAFTCAPAEEIWLGADFRDASRINVYASKTEGNLIQATNLLISEVDSNVTRGGAVGVMAYEVNARFFRIRAGSPRRVDKAEWAALAERALMTADQAGLLAYLQCLPGLVGLWPMSSVQPSTGLAYDLSGQGRNLASNGNPLYNFLANGTPYLDLDGTGDYLSRADEADLDIVGTEACFAAAARGLTLGIWWRPDTQDANYETIAGKVDNGQRAYWIDQNISADPKLRGVVSIDGTAQTIVTSTGALTIGAWSFCVMRFTPSTELAVFLNGVKTVNTTSIPATIFVSTAAFEIGASYGAANFADAGVSLCFLCANALPDAVIDGIFKRGRGLFGV